MSRCFEQVDRRAILVASLWTTFVVTRTWLHIRPDTDLTLGSYNIHHLFTGVIILAACGIPSVLRPVDDRLGAALVAGFGAGLALILDEWVYLIVTDGSNAAYVQWPSLLGGAILVGAAYAWLLPRGEQISTSPDRPGVRPQSTPDPKAPERKAEI